MAKSVREKPQPSEDDWGGLTRSIRQPPCPNATAGKAELGTKWERYWHCQPNAVTMCPGSGRHRNRLEAKTFKCHSNVFPIPRIWQSTGLKIRSPQDGVGSSPTLGAID